MKNVTQPAPAYLIARVDVTDPGQYRRYLEAVPAVIAKYGGTPLARSASPLALEGPDERRRIVILRFPGMEKAREFYHSPEYRTVRKLREGAATGEMIVIEGIETPGTDA